MKAYTLERIDTGHLARIDFRAKLALVLLGSTLIFVWNGIAAQAALLAATLGLLLAAGIAPHIIGRLVVITLPALVLVTTIQGLFSPFGVTPVLTIPADVPLVGGMTLFTVEGLLFGLVVCCRLLVPMLVFQYLFITTAPNEIVVGLTRLRVPYRIALLFSTTFRFVPLLLSEFGAIRDAQRLRGIDINSYGLMRKLLALGRMLVPLITGSMAKGQEMEIALQARAFTGYGRRTALHPTRERMTAFERAIMAAAPSILALAILARAAFGFGGAVL